MWETIYEPIQGDLVLYPPQISISSKILKSTPRTSELPHSKEETILRHPVITEYPRSSWRKSFKILTLWEFPGGLLDKPPWGTNITEYDEIGPKVTRLRTKLESFSPGTSRIICDDTKLQWKIPQLPIITDYFWRASKKSFKFKPYWR